MEKKSGYCLKTLFTDGGGEFTSNKFNSYCKINGIQRKLTASYTPQQNGIVERKNGTIFEMARSMMMKGKNLPNIFCAEAIATYFISLIDAQQEVCKILPLMENGVEENPIFLI